MKDIVIFVEGKADLTFIRDYICYHIEAVTLISENGTEVVLEKNDRYLKIEVAGGYTAIKEEKLLNRIKGYADPRSNYNLFIIIDADDPSIDDGGFSERKKFLENFKSKHNVYFDAFLFPNNSSDGDLESLLIEIVNKEKYEQTGECYNKLIECSQKYCPSIIIDELIKKKMRIYNYFRSFYGMNRAQEGNRKFETKYWELDHDYLNPLKNFMFKITEQ